MKWKDLSLKERKQIYDMIYIEIKTSILID